MSSESEAESLSSENSENSAGSEEEVLRILWKILKFNILNNDIKIHVKVKSIFSGEIEKFSSLVKFGEILKSLTLAKIDNMRSVTLTPNLNFGFLVVIFYGEIIHFDQIFVSNRPKYSIGDTLNFWVLTPEPKISILTKFWSLLKLISSNFDRSRRQLSNDTKIIKLGQNWFHLGKFFYHCQNH